MHLELKEGIDLYNQKQYQEALVFFLSVETEGSVMETEVNYYIGLSYSRLEEYEKAMEYLEQVVTANTDIAKVYQCRLILSFIYTKTDRTKLAEFELSKLLEAGYESTQVFSSMAFIAYEHNEIEKAIEYYERALKITPENSTALNGLGYVLAETEQDLPRALDLCKKAIEKQPENAAYLDSIAFAHFKMNETAPAFEFIKKAKEKQPLHPIILDHYRQIIEETEEA